MEERERREREKEGKKETEEEKDLRESKVVMCDNLDKLKKEGLGWGNANALVKYDPDEPRPVGFSRFCGLQSWV